MPVEAQAAERDGVGRWRNLAYALQWWLFAAAAVFFWWPVLRRAALEQREPDPAARRRSATTRRSATNDMNGTVPASSTSTVFTAFQRSW